MSTIHLDADTIQSMLKYAHEFANANGIELDHSGASIKKLDMLLNEFHEGYGQDPNPDHEALSGLALSLGVYIGEVLKQDVRDVRWRYGVPATGGTPTAYLSQGDNEVYPVDWVAKQIMDGPKESILKKYKLFSKKLI